MIKFKSKFIIVSIFALFFIPNIIFSQSATVEKLQKEIISLKQAINELNTRIEKLEKIFNNIEISESKTSQSYSSVSHKNQLPWHNKKNWEKIRDGMSESQVISILGEPTSKKDVGSYKTIFYQGEVSGSGFVSGNIKFDEDRVWGINIPVF